MGEPLMWATIACAGVIAVFAGMLLGVYIRSYQKLRAPYTFGLAVFAGLFLVQGLIIGLGAWYMIPFVVGPLAPFLLGLAVLEAGGLGAVLLVSY